MKIKFVKVLLFAFTTAVAGANTPSYDSYREKMSGEFERFKKNALSEYESFRKKANDDYAEFLKRSWEQFDALKSPHKPKDDKPVPPKPYQEDETPIKDTPLPFKDIVKPQPPEPQPLPVKPIEPVTVVDEWHKFSFYGTDMKVRLAKNMRFTLKGCDGNAIAAGWKILSQQKYNNLINDCLEIRKDCGLCDWGYLMMLREMSRSFMGGDCNEARLLMAYVYCQSGYKMKLANSKKRLYMLYASRHVMYDNSYFLIDGANYYPLDCDEDRIYVNDASFPNEQPLSLYMARIPKLGVENTPDRQLSSKRYAEANAVVSTNKNLIEFYGTYPASEVGNNFMTKWAMYANTPISDQARLSLYPRLKNSISGKTQQQSVEILLNFVQTAFVYGYDSKIWGYDRAFFADETLFYPYSDCEDRSILFSRLVRDLVGLSVVLVYYPGHLATAVEFSTMVKGDYLSIDGRKFVVCDPTYIGAPVGRTMPDMDNSVAKVILLE
ncbi:MAG: hypothetical protein IJY31_05465 [Muribaculaceae bacterium]|nr:hypothetical protein [Muribaculaceae bacterium]